MTPASAASISARAHDALDELRSLHDSDPAARSAMLAIRLTERTLADFWIPPLGRRIDTAER